MLIVWEMVACPRLSSKANSITRLAELADPRYAVNPSSSETWWPSTSLHSHGKHLLVTAIDGVPLWVMVVHCQPQAAQKNMEKSRAHRRQWWAIVFLNFIFVLLSPQGRIQGGEEIGAIAPLKPTKVTLFTTIFYNLENNIHDIRPFRRLLFCYNSFVKHTFSLLQ